MFKSISQKTKKKKSDLIPQVKKKNPHTPLLCGNPDSHKGHRLDGRRYGDNGRRVAADDGDDLVAVDLQPVVEADHDVVGEHAGGALLEKRWGEKKKKERVDPIFRTHVISNKVIKKKILEET